MWISIELRSISIELRIIDIHVLMYVGMWI